MLVEPEAPSVEVRSGQRLQLVTRWASRFGLYVFSEHGICASVVHQWPGAQPVQLTAPDAAWKFPGLQIVQAALPLTAA